MLRNELIEYCAPTLAGIKTGNMFTIADYPCDVTDQIRELNRILTPRGLRLIALDKLANANYTDNRLATTNRLFSYQRIN